MKRKWFTLLFALLALASFQVSAQTLPSKCNPVDGYWWMKVDVTGLALSGANQLPYSGNKEVLPNFLVYKGGDYPVQINDGTKSIRDLGDLDQFKVSLVNDNMINIFPKAYPSWKLWLPYNGNNWSQFEVVQFTGDGQGNVGDQLSPGYLTSCGWNRTTQQLTADGMEGYLMVAQGGQQNTGVLQKDTTSSMLMVVADKDRHLSIQRFDHVFKVIAPTAAVPPQTTVPVDSFTLFNFSDPAVAAVFDLANMESRGWLVPYTGANTDGFSGDMGITVAAGDVYAGLIMQQGYSNRETGTTDIAGIMAAYVNSIGGKIVYANSVIMSNPAEWMKNPANCTEYKGATISANLTQFFIDVKDVNMWSNGLPVIQPITNPVTGAQDLYYMCVSAPTQGTVVNDGSIVPLVPGTPAVAGSISGYTQEATAKGWQPVYVKLVPPSGRWATAADFPSSTKWWNFLRADGSKLAIPTATTSDPYLSSTKTDAFSVSVADYINWDPNNQSGHNIFGYQGEYGVNATNLYPYTKFNPQTVGGDSLGLQLDFDPGTGGVSTGEGAIAAIPLFVLAGPDCKVLSVSRINDLNQTQPDGVLANKLEMRAYGTYYDFFDKDGKYGTYTPHISSPDNQWDVEYLKGDTAGLPAGLREDRVATSLQKFAIWIDECGNKVLYPVASYFWKYGNDKKPQPNNVYPNSVLMYNNTKVAQTYNGVTNADQGYGVKISSWTGNASLIGKNTANPGPPHVGDILTGPNDKRTTSDYAEEILAPNKGSVGEKATIGDYWFFLQVPSGSTTVEQNKVNNSYNGTYFAPNALQDATQTDYVLQAVTKSDGTQGLIMLPKEKVRGYGPDAVIPQNMPRNMWYSQLQAFKAIEKADPNTGEILSQYLLPDYWSNNPFDSVNVAAHWKATKISDGVYKIENMYHQVLYTPAGGNTWNVSVSGSNFLLTADDGSVLSVNDEGNAWYQGITRGKADSVYFQKDVHTLTPLAPADLGFPLEVADAGKGCVVGMPLTTSPIYYVPNFSGSYADEIKGDPNKNVINTNDPNFQDGTMYKDSITNYLYLHGNYGIKEALIVNNKLLLDTLRTETGSLAAALSAEKDVQVEFVPLASVYSDRASAIDAQKGNLTTGVDIDKHQADQYKWFLVKRGNYYLQFDTLNPGASNNRLKVGLTFSKVTGDIANATPVRLFQPLVGDKLQGNFIFQFNIPYNHYNTNPNKIYVNTWPDIKSDQVSNNIVDPTLNGKMVWGQLSDQSNFILANEDRTKGTRLTYVVIIKPTQTCCPTQFIEPDWMAQEKLLGLPLKNKIWDVRIQDFLKPTTPGFGFGFGGTNNAEAIVSGTQSANITQLTHIWDQTISKGVYTYPYWDAVHKEVGMASAVICNGGVEVPLYRIVNNKGQYLTVSDTTYQYDSRSTDTDVTGVNLVWSDVNYADHVELYGDPDITLNKIGLQLFAISGAQKAPSDNVNGWYPDCDAYVYLPLASYKVQYKKGVVLKDAIFYNENLGTKGDPGCNDPDLATIPWNDVTQAWRVSQYTPTGETQQNLIVVNTTGGDRTSIVPVELKWQKNKYDQIKCDVLVKNIDKRNPKGDFYYGAGLHDAGIPYDSLCTANSNTLLAHWNVSFDASAADPYLHNFALEKVMGYDGKVMGRDQINLGGDYYFLIDDAKSTAKSTVVRAFNFDNYTTAPYTIGVDTFELTCIDHTLPFANLEKDPWAYELPAQLAIIETPYLDRNLSDIPPTGNVVKIQTVGPDGSVTTSYQTYLYKNDSIGGGITYLNAYPTNVRRLAAGKNGDNTGHDIPYYAFSLTRDGDSNEYFLNVRTSVETKGRGDSVYWTAVTPAVKKAIVETDYASGNQQFSDKGKRYANFKFCLPYQVKTYKDAEDGRYPNKQIGDLVDKMSYTYKNGVTVNYQPVYLQTLDTALSVTPYLVVAGAATKFGTAVNLQQAILPDTLVCSKSYINLPFNSLAGNIYTVDYANIDPHKVTSWIFGGQQPNPTQWVPLNNKIVNDTIVPQNTMGYLTDYKLQGGGVTFLDESAQGVNYGILTGIDNSVKLSFAYEGTEQIKTSSMWKVPIYYYRISIPSSKFAGSLGKRVWLTDSRNLGSEYNFIYQSVTNKLAYFSDVMLPKNLPGTPIVGTGDKTSYDKTFTQSIALRYVHVANGAITVSDGTEPAQTFVVVSNADWTNPNEDNYRYLQDVGNNHLAFVTGKAGLENAMVFQFGGVSDDGKYTGIDAVAASDIIGVTGGVKLLNQAGNVVSLYTVDGSLIKTVQVTGADQTVGAPRGVVIVKVADQVAKVIVK